MKKQEPERFEPSSRAEWRNWFLEHYSRNEGVWLILWKKAKGEVNLTYAEAVEESLCFGWIDSKPSKLDAFRSMLWFSPRKPGSGWSRVNKIRLETLLANGAMHPAGLKRIEEAKKDGSWEKLDNVEALEIPEDLGAAFNRYPGSAENFEAFPKSAKRGILEWILNAKRPETRAARLEETARLAAVNERANQWKKG